MIFQRGNPMDYERWGADPGMETWDYAHCLPYFKQDGGLPRRRPGRRVPRARRPAHARARPGDQPAVPGVLRRDRAGRLPAHRRTSTATGRRASPPFDRNVRRGRRWSAARAYLHPVLNRPEPRADHAARYVDQGAVRRHPGDRRRVPAPAPQAHDGAGRAPSSCAAARSTPRSCCSCPASATPTNSRALGIDVRADLPGVGENMQDHLEVYIQYACTQPVSVQKYLK